MMIKICLVIVVFNLLASAMYFLFQTAQLGCCKKADKSLMSILNIQISSVNSFKR